jgi:sugar lactone lactonase YvrE
VTAYEAAVNPGGGPVDSNPYGLLEGAGKRIVAEAGGNALLRVHSNGNISTLAIFPSRPQGRDTDSVPTSVVFRRGAFYVGELTGFPFPEGGASVYRVRPGEPPEVFLEGFTAIIDLDFDRRGNLYVLQFASETGLSGPGVLIRVDPDGTRTIVATGLAAPTSVAIGPDGNAYVSNCGACPAGAGQVIRIDLPDPDDEEEDDD